MVVTATTCLLKPLTVTSVWWVHLPLLSVNSVRIPITGCGHARLATSRCSVYTPTLRLTALLPTLRTTCLTTQSTTHLLVCKAIRTKTSPWPSVIQAAPTATSLHTAFSNVAISRIRHVCRHATSSSQLWRSIWTPTKTCAFSTSLSMQALPITGRTQWVWTNVSTLSDSSDRRLNTKERLRTGWQSSLQRTLQQM